MMFNLSEKDIDFLKETAKRVVNQPFVAFSDDLGTCVYKHEHEGLVSHCALGVWLDNDIFNNEINNNEGFFGWHKDLQLEFFKHVGLEYSTQEKFEHSLDLITFIQCLHDSLKDNSAFYNVINIIVSHKTT